MATAKNVDFRQNPNKDTTDHHRPLSVYDNLNATGNVININNTSTSENLDKANAYNNNNAGDASTQTTPVPSNDADHEYPFSDISFKFDDFPIKPCSVSRSDSLNNNSRQNRISGGNGSDANLNSFRSAQSNSSQYGDSGNGSSISGGTGPLASHETHSAAAVATAAATPSAAAAAIVSAANEPVTASNRSSAHKSYENIGETGSISHRGYQHKPVMSDAKSTFFGLNKNHNNAISNKNGDDDGISGASAQNSGAGVKSTASPIHYGDASSESEPLISLANIAGAKPNIVRGNNHQTNYDGANEGGSGGSMTEDSSETATQKSDSDIVRSNSYSLSDKNGRSAKPFSALENGGDKKNHNLSQAVYMTTTVPQNIKGTNIMGSHTPTRSSLRHSRMLVVNKNYQVPRRRNSLNIKHPIWAKIILAFHILVGLAVSCLGLWLCWWAPSTRSRDNPYWSGLILILSGILGFVLFGFRRMPRHKLREHLFKFFYLNSTLVTVVAGLCTLAASIFATYHIVRIFTYGHQCTPAIMLQASSACICNYSNSNTTNPSRLQAQSESELTIAAHEFYYRDLNCTEVTGAFKYILLSSSILNFIGFLICTTFLCLLCVKNTVKRKSYAQVRTP